jgi:hypothetical protein
MGQGQIDLPDPLEQPHLDEESADELLAQLAGEEIDRLLRENDIERVPAVLVHDPAEAPLRQPKPFAPRTAGPSPTAAPTRRTDPAADPPLTLADIDEQGAKAAEAVIQQHGATPGAVTQATAEAAATATTAHEIDTELARQLDDVFAQIKNPEAALPPVPANQAANLAQQALLADPRQQVDKAVDLLEQIGLLEKQILNTEILQKTQQLLAEPVLKGNDSAENDEGQKLPLYLRPLEWLNLPLSFCGDSVRDTLGKVAIVTLVNALAILLYVLIFR